MHHRTFTAAEIFPLDALAAAARQERRELATCAAFLSSAFTLLVAGALAMPAAPYSRAAVLVAPGFFAILGLFSGLMAWSARRARLRLEATLRERCGLDAGATWTPVPEKALSDMVHDQSLCDMLLHGKDRLDASAGR